MSEDMPITKDPHIRRSVIAGVISSLLVIIFFQPLLTLAWSALLSMGTTSSQYIVDSFYSIASVGHRNNVAVVILWNINIVFLGSMLMVNLIITRKVVQSWPRPHKLSKRYLAFMWLLFFMFAAAAIYQSAAHYIDLQLNASFQQRLKVLAPVISDLHMKEFEAAWASMKTRGDYLVIKSRMEAAASQHNIALPKALWK